MLRLAVPPTETGRASPESAYGGPYPADRTVATTASKSASPYLQTNSEVKQGPRPRAAACSARGQLSHNGAAAGHPRSRRVHTLYGLRARTHLGRRPQQPEAKAGGRGVCPPVGVVRVTRCSLLVTRCSPRASAMILQIIRIPVVSAVGFRRGRRCHSTPSCARAGARQGALRSAAQRIARPCDGTACLRSRAI